MRQPTPEVPASKRFKRIFSENILPVLRRFRFLGYRRTALSPNDGDKDIVVPKVYSRQNEGGKAWARLRYHRKANRDQQLSTILHHTNYAITVAVLCLSEISQMTKSVPYIQSVSSVITYIVKANDDIITLRDRRAALVERVTDIQHVIDNLAGGCNMEAVLCEGMEKPFEVLESVLGQILEILKSCSGRRITLFLHRSRLLSQIDKCDNDLKMALDLFNMTVHIIQAVDLDAVKSKITELKGSTENISLNISMMKKSLESQNVYSKQSHDQRRSNQPVYSANQGRTDLAVLQFVSFISFFVMFFIASCWT